MSLYAGFLTGFEDIFFSPLLLTDFHKKEIEKRKEKKKRKENKRYYHPPYSRGSDIIKEQRSYLDLIL